MALSHILSSVAVAAMLASSPAIAAPRSLDDPDQPAHYVRTDYDGTIWEVTEDRIYALDWEEWRSLGTPAFTAASTEYIKVLSMPTVYAVTKFGASDDEWLTEPITAAQYRNARSPRVGKASWIEGLRLVKWQTSSELIASDPNGNTVKLTYAQWRAAGFPDFSQNSNRGFIKMSWDGSGAIAYMCDIAGGRGGTLTYSQWQSLGSPTPQSVTRTASDIVYQVAGANGRPTTSTISYMGPTMRPYAPGVISSARPGVALTFAQWSAMGRPAPDVGNIFYPENFVCNSGAPGPSE